MFHRNRFRKNKARGSTETRVTFDRNAQPQKKKSAKYCMVSELITE